MDYNKKILIIDDCKSVRGVLLKVIGELGFANVDATGSPKEALEILRTTDYDLVLIDWHMPEMEGLELFEIIKEEPEINKDLKSVMFTGENAREKVVLASKLPSWLSC